MTSTEADKNLEALLTELDLPDRAYELAERRYEDLGAWIRRPGSSLEPFDAHIFVQGSFAFGTAIQPVNDEDEYDLDFSCKLRKGVARDTHSQQQLKTLVSIELKAYREARQITKPLVEKNRCWRLGYKDELAFHMDVVPGIRADTTRRAELRTRMEQAGVNSTLAEEAARRALWITDLQDPNYERVSQDWPSSNPGGYQLWFQAQMRGVEEPGVVRSQVDPLPVYRSKTPLQHCVQLLKRHRDVMFKDACDRKPASIIITTVSARAYRAGESLSLTMQRTLDALEEIRRSGSDAVFNPVNPKENFADRWMRPELQHLRLKANFHAWTYQASKDFREFLTSAPRERLLEVAQDSFQVNAQSRFARNLGVAASTAAATSFRSVAAQPSPPRPWCT
ncbi:MAG: nucleotidyltransferase [Alcaligenaceae bacterium]|nr:MAG: nucleotidyltransferase [Alcaligenaceae bacterium]